MTLILRRLTPEDNPGVKALVQNTLAEFGYRGAGIAADDPELDDCHGFYSQARRDYWVVVDEETQKVLAGGGYAQLLETHAEEGICEFQKFYTAPQIRGQGWGRQILEACLDGARRDGFKMMYLETLEGLRRSTSLYERFGFQYRETPLGDTGHNKRCSIYMTLTL